MIRELIALAFDWLLDGDLIGHLYTALDIISGEVTTDSSSRVVAVQDP